LTKNVVHVVAAGEIGGAERMLTDLARPGASSRRHSIALFTPNDRLRAFFRDAGIEVDDRGRVREGVVPYLASTLGRDDVRWLAKILEQRQAGIVHLHTFASQVLGTRAAERTGARIVRTEHSTRVYEDPSCWPFAKWSLKRADAVVCISDHIREVATSRAPFLQRVLIVHNGVDTSHFSPVRVPVPVPEMTRFIALGRLDARKGLDLALEALSLVDDVTLDIAGDGDERASLEALASKLGLRDRVRFLGWQSDARPAIADADAALSSARTEGLGIALLEAMAMARPVVGVPIGGIPEIVRDGETGWLAETRSAPALASAMRAAASNADERARRGLAARDRAVAHFSVDAMRRGYEAIYAAL
jgi:glycosyltransferase involved in cell wall biosynthesis